MLVRVGDPRALGFTTLVMSNSLIQTDHISRDAVVGGTCVFLLVGLCFTMTFILLAELEPNAFVFLAPLVALDVRRARGLVR